ncbi:MAG: hypothetical protein QXR58_00945, partial [Candidatus Micrarchaeaceae archaeon]
WLYPGYLINWHGAYTAGRPNTIANDYSTSSGLVDVGSTLSTSGDVAAPLGFTWIATGEETSYFDYSSLSATDTTYSLPSSYYVFAGSNTGVYWYWVRTRAYPPNGVMPSVSFGSVA